MNNITKKAYVKPDIALVDFSLSSSIAASCKFSPTYEDENSCIGYIENEYIVYSDGCEIDPIAPDFCYHVPTADANVFIS